MPDGTTVELAAKPGEGFMELSLGGGSDTVNIDSAGYQFQGGNVRVSYDWLLSATSTTGVVVSYEKMARIIPTPASAFTTPSAPTLWKQGATATYAVSGIAGADTLTNVERFKDSALNDTFNFSNHIYRFRGFYSDTEFRSSSNAVRLTGGSDVVKGNGHTQLDFSGQSTTFGGLKINLGDQAKLTTQSDLYYGVTTPLTPTAKATVGSVTTTTGATTTTTPAYTVFYSGVDYVVATSGADTLIAGSSQSWLGVSYWDAGSDWFVPGAGQDTITGGVGETGISYWNAPNGVTFDVWNGKAFETPSSNETFWNSTDSFTGVNNFEGSDFADTYKAASTGNLSLDPTQGGKYVNKGWWGDYNFFLPGGGDDTITGNYNTRISYNSALLAVNIDLSGQDTTNTKSGFAAPLIVASQHTITNNVGYDTLVGVAGMEGSAFGDKLTGDSKNNYFRGNAGKDSINGGSGNDTADYGNSPAPVFLKETTSTVGDVTTSSWQALDGWGFIDELTSIERIGASQFDDYISLSSTFTHEVNPRRGNDTIERIGTISQTYVDYSGSPAGVSVYLAALSTNYNLGYAYDGYLSDGSSQVLNAENTTNLYKLAMDKGATLPVGVTLSKDTLININAIYGSSFDDYFLGGNQDDYFLPRSGLDTIDGGTGNDIVFFGEAPNATRFETGFLRGIVLDLKQAADSDGFISISSSYGGQPIKVKNTETYYGSQFNDKMTGSDGNDFLAGEGGNDTISSGLGNDTLQGGSGNDTIDGGLGTDVLQLPGKYSDYIYTLESNTTTSTTGTFVINRASGSDAGIDRVTGVESFEFLGDNPKIIKTNTNLYTSTVDAKGTIKYALGKSINTDAPSLAALAVTKTANDITVPATSSAQKSLLPASFDNTATQYTDGTVVKLYTSGTRPYQLTDTYNNYVVTNSNDQTFSLTGYVGPAALTSINTTPTIPFTTTFVDGSISFKATNPDSLKKGTYLFEVTTPTVTKSSVDIRDLIEALSFLTGDKNTIPYYKLVAADADQNGKIDLADMIPLLKMALYKSDVQTPKLIMMKSDYATMTNGTPNNPYVALKAATDSYPGAAALAKTSLNQSFNDLSVIQVLDLALVGIWTGDVNANYYP